MPARETSQTILGHLVELRKSLVRGISAIVISSALLFPFANQLYLILAEPLLTNLQLEGGQMIATQVASPFLTPFKLALISGIFVSMPVLLYQLWSFIAPGLYQHEKRLALPLLSMSIVLFYAGMAFAYWIVFPIMFAFLIGTAPEGVQVATDIALYLNFAIKIFFAFGFAFQIPVATVLLIVLGFVEPRKLRKKRPYIVVGAFILGMLLTPPDVISQTLLAIPIWLLFEVGVWVGLVLQKHHYKISNQAQGESDSQLDQPLGAEAYADEFGEVEDYKQPTEEELEQLLDQAERADKKSKPKDSAD